MKKTTLSIFAAMGLSLLAIPGLARPPGMGMGDMDPMAHIERLADRLDLSQEQEDQLAEIINATRSDSAQDRKRMRELRQQMQELSENFDEGRAQSLADEMGQITARQTYTRLSTMAKVNSVLTPEQREKMAEMKEKRKARREEKSDKRRDNRNQD